MRVVIHRGALAAMFTPEGEVGRSAARGAGRVRDRAKEGSTVDTGLMRNSIVSERVASGSPYTITFRIGSDVFYTRYQELGTPPIFARRAPLLVFKVGNRWISTYSTKGVPAVRMLTKAVEATTSADFL
jgi:bacteriophage HK97-gp10 putative tail-component